MDWEAELPYTYAGGRGSRVTTYLTCKKVGWKSVVTLYVFLERSTGKKTTNFCMGGGRYRVTALFLFDLVEKTWAQKWSYPIPVCGKRIESVESEISILGKRSRVTAL